MATEQKPLREFPKEMVHTILDYLPEDKVMQFIASNAVPCKEFELHNYMYNRIYNKIKPHLESGSQGYGAYFLTLAEIILGDTFNKIKFLPAPATGVPLAFMVSGNKDVCTRRNALPSKVKEFNGLRKSTYDHNTNTWDLSENSTSLQDIWMMRPDRTTTRCLCDECISNAIFLDRERLGHFVTHNEILKETIDFYISELDAKEATIKLLNILRTRNNL